MGHTSRYVLSINLFECKNMVVKMLVNSEWIYVHVPDTYKSCKMNTE